MTFQSPLLAALLLSAALCAAPVQAQPATAEIDAIFDWATSGTPGCSVAVAQNGKVVVSAAYGLADLERNVPITPDSIFDAASIQKQFVAAATLMLVQEGKLSLSDDVRKHVPELHDFGHTITIDHLLTHTSGLRDWTGMLPLMANEVDALTLTFRQRGLNFTPGTEWSYSNSGYVLLKEIIARRSGMSVDDFMQRRIFDPLGMKSTSYRTDLREVVRDRALAYEKERDEWKLAVLLDEDRGGGGALLSTPSDLIRWNEALASGSLGEFITGNLHEPARLSNGRRLGYARGLFLDENHGGRIIWHTGGAHGYESLLARYPEHELSVAIMCNADGTERVAYARRIFDLFVPTPASAAAKEEVIETTPPAADVTDRAGLYFSDAGSQPLQLVARDGALRVAGGPALMPVGEGIFQNSTASLQFMSDDTVQVRFVSADEFVLKSSDGKRTRYYRARSYAPSKADLQAFAGRFESDEIGTIFVVSPAEGGLAVSLEHAPGKMLPFRPVHPDTFQAGRMMIRFARDEKGNVTRLDYSNPVIRNVPFQRLDAEPKCR